MRHAAMNEASRQVSQLRQDVRSLKGSLPEGPPAPANPLMVVVSGLPGSGKSYFARKLVEQVPLLVLESDALRKVLFPAPCYSSGESSRLFEACYLLIEQLLWHGVPVLLDATNLLESNRERLYNIAGRTGARFILVHITAPAAVVHERLQGRSRGKDPDNRSDADWGVYRKMHATSEPIKRDHFVVDTSGDITPGVARIAREIRRWTCTAGS